MSFTKLLFLLTSLLLTLCSQSHSFFLLFFFLFLACTLLYGGGFSGPWMIPPNMWVWRFCPIAWCSWVCCKQRVLHQPHRCSDCSNSGIAAASSGLRRSPAVSEVGHAASTQRDPVSTKQPNMLESSGDGWCNTSCTFYLQCLAVLMSWTRLVLCSRRDCLYTPWVYFLFRLTFSKR